MTDDETPIDGPDPEYIDPGLPELPDDVEEVVPTDDTPTTDPEAEPASGTEP